LAATWPLAFNLPGDSCTAVALDPAKPRTLVFYHPAAKLGGTVTVRGDEKEPVVAKLAAAGAFTGKALDTEGSPIAGAEVTLNFPNQAAGELYRHLQVKSEPVVTGKDGSFRLDGVVPGVKVGLQIHKDRTYFVGEPRIGYREVEPGKTLEMGDMKLKAIRP
jgi:hypothetical protein